MNGETSEEDIKRAIRIERKEREIRRRFYREGIHGID